MIPPALAEVGQLMLERIFQNFETNRCDHAEPVITNDQCLETGSYNVLRARFKLAYLQPPAEEMRDDEKVHFILNMTPLFTPSAQSTSIYFEEVKWIFRMFPVVDST